MNNLWVMLLGSLLVGFGLGSVLGRLAARAQRQADAEDHQRWLVLRDALQALPKLPNAMVMFDAVKEAVGQTTRFRAHLLLAEGGQITDDQMVAAPFFVEPHLTRMAVRLRQRVSSAALAPLGWGCAYIPLCAGSQLWGVLVLTRPADAPWRPEELACCDILAQSLGASIGAAKAQGA